MDKRITRYNSLKAMKSDEYRSWQRLPEASEFAP
jgi:hypothetical protein